MLSLIYVVMPSPRATVRKQTLFPVGEAVVLEVVPGMGVVTVAFCEVLRGDLDVFVFDSVSLRAFLVSFLSPIEERSVSVGLSERAEIRVVYQGRYIKS